MLIVRMINPETDEADIDVTMRAFRLASEDEPKVLEFLNTARPGDVGMFGYHRLEIVEREGVNDE